MSDLALTPIAVSGPQPVLIRPMRSIGGFVAQVTIEENHEDEIEITQQPLEKGAPISDHAFKRPPSITIRCGWSNSPAAGGDDASPDDTQSVTTGNNVNQVKDVYAKLLALQESFVLFEVLTGKRPYTNMLFKSLRVTTNMASENSLMVTAVLQQVIIVSSKAITVSAPAANQANPAKTNAPVKNGLKQVVPATNFNALVK